MFGFMVHADIYMQYPMGSNNRLDDENRDRNNGNRLFDSQNNNRGGYNVGNVFFYVGTKVPMKWTAQHSCGNPNNHCEMVIQMMCSQKLRDGTTTKTIPDNPVECYNWDCDSDVRYGRHESFSYYQTCKRTERNKGLFIASQNVKGQSAIYTRQNPNGARRGYECPEERDYYPYWRPTPWVDIAYFTNDATACPAIVAQSANVQDRFACVIKEQYLYMKDVFKNKYLPIDEKNCTLLKFMVANMVNVTDPVTGAQQFDPETGEPVQVVGDPAEKPIFPGKWKRVRHNAALKAAVGEPVCAVNTWSRDNHHGNGVGGDFVGFEWTVPNFIHDSCVLRLRYNISTTDLPHLRPNNLSTDANLDLENPLTGRYHPGMSFGFNKTEIDENGYYLKNNPQVAPFIGYTSSNGEAFIDTDGNPLKFQLAVNTAQFGRTFQDRSHRFSIKARPPSIPAGSTLHNLNVRGKRGNIVQTYPGTEYSFSPEELVMAKGDYVHIQWVGSNTNPNNNAGQGRQGSDRHNMATLAGAVYKEDGQPDAVNVDPAKNIYGQLGRSYPAHLEASPFLGFPNRVRQKLAILKGVNTNGGELSELDDSSTFANFPPMEITKTGFFNYLCTRNNNFSNRSQKGKITVVEPGTMVMSEMVSYSGATLTAGGATLTVSKGSTAGEFVQFVPLGHKDNPDGFCHPRCGSNYFELPNAPPQDASTNLRIPYETRADGIPIVYHTPQNSISASDSSWNKLDATCSDGFCSVPANNKGVYVVWNEFSWWVYLLSIIAIIVTLVIVFCLVKRFKGSS